MHALLCWDIASNGILQAMKHHDRQKLQQLAKKYQWQFSPDELLAKEYEAIVVTDVTQKIQWASPGFLKMTGYSPALAKNRKPSFLQGKDTSPATRQQVREAIQQGKSIAATLLNYRRNGTPYQCYVEIQPLYNNEKLLTHFIAFEREV